MRGERDERTVAREEYEYSNIVVMLIGSYLRENTTTRQILEDFGSHDYCLFEFGMMVSVQLQLQLDSSSSSRCNSHLLKQKLTFDRFSIKQTSRELKMNIERLLSSSPLAIDDSVLQFKLTFDVSVKNRGCLH